MLPFLWWRRIKHLNYVVLTHAHNNHIAGLIPVLKNLRVDELWTGRISSTPLVRELLGKARRHGVFVREVNRMGQELELQRGLAGSLRDARPALSASSFAFGINVMAFWACSSLSNKERQASTFPNCESSRSAWLWDVQHAEGG
ncbi:MAG: hypothetical protein PHX83_15675 [Acidobacteriia bacterium]|nr:hypothetical protein [Terriglobia bacterium]